MANDSEGASDGLQQLRAMLAGGLRAPMGDKLGLTLVEVEHGHVVFEGTPVCSVYNPLGSGHGGYAATLLDSACGIAVHSQLGSHRGHTTLELKVSLVRGLSERTHDFGQAARGFRGSDAPRRRRTAVRHVNVDAARAWRRTPVRQIVMARIDVEPDIALGSHDGLTAGRLLLLASLAAPETCRSGMSDVSVILLDFATTPSIAVVTEQGAKSAPRRPRRVTGGASGGGSGDPAASCPRNTTR